MDTLRSILGSGHASGGRAAYASLLSGLAHQFRAGMTPAEEAGSAGHDAGGGAPGEVGGDGPGDSPPAGAVGGAPGGGSAGGAGAAPGASGPPRELREPREAGEGGAGSWDSTPAGWGEGRRGRTHEEWSSRGPRRAASTHRWWEDPGGESLGAAGDSRLGNWPIGDPGEQGRVGGRSDTWEARLDWGRTPSPVDQRWGGTPYPAYGRVGQSSDQRWDPYRGHERAWQVDPRDQEGHAGSRHLATPAGGAGGAGAPGGPPGPAVGAHRIDPGWPQHVARPADASPRGSPVAPRAAAAVGAMVAGGGGAVAPGIGKPEPKRPRVQSEPPAWYQSGWAPQPWDPSSVSIAGRAAVAPAWATPGEVGPGSVIDLWAPVPWDPRSPSLAGGGGGEPRVTPRDGQSPGPGPPLAGAWPPPPPPWAPGGVPTGGEVGAPGVVPRSDLNLGSGPVRAGAWPPPPLGGAGA